jgi:dipeptidyl aminopeptidase/acylaminoacyl peptidase
VKVRAAGFSFLAAFAAASATFSAEPALADASIVSWWKPGFQIRHPEFSPDGKELLLELRAYKQALRMLMEDIDGSKTKARNYDPRVGILRIADQHFEELGYGREPRFSPDGHAIVFVAQAKPTTLERFELFENLEGNHLALYERASRRTRASARPEWGFHSAPSFSPDGKRALFLQYTPAAGPHYSVRLSELDLANRKTRVLYEPPSVPWNPARVVQYGFVQGRLLALLEIPRSAPKEGHFQAEYLERLAEIGEGTATELFSRDLLDPTIEDVQEMDRLHSLFGGSMFFDGRWRRLTKEGLLGDHIGPVFDTIDDPGRPSPDGRLLAHAVADQSESGVMIRYVALVVEEIDTGKVIARFPLDKQKGVRTESIAWSHDSRLLAWSDFATENWADDHDTLYVAILPRDVSPSTGHSSSTR